MAAAPAGHAPALLQQLDQIGPRGAQRGQQTEEQAGGEGQPEDERDGAPVERDLVEAREAPRAQHPEHRDAGPGQEEGGETTGAGEHQALGQPLPDQPAPARSEGGADRHFLAAREPLGEQEARHVRAGDQEDERDRPREDEQGRTHAAHHRLLQRLDVHGDARVRLGTLRLEAPGHHAQLGPGLLQGRPRAQAPEHPQEAAMARFRLRREDERRPQLRGRGPERREPEAGRHHARDHVALAVEDERLPDQAGIGAESPLPEAVAQDDLRLVARRVEDPAQGGLDAEEGEQAGRGLQGRQLFGPATAGEDRRPGVGGGEAIEGPASPPPFQEIRRRRRIAGFAAPCLVRESRHEPVGFAVGQRAEEDRIDDGEDGGVRADAEGQGRDRHRGHAGPPGDGPQALPQVSKELAHGPSRCVP